MGHAAFLAQATEAAAELDAMGPMRLHSALPSTPQETAEAALAAASRRTHRDADASLAWAGGVLEAKGYAYLSKAGRRFLRLTDTRRELLEAFVEIVGEGSIRDYGVPSEASTMPQFRWEIFSRDAIEAVLDLLDPYLLEGTRKRLRAVL